MESIKKILSHDDVVIEREKIGVIYEKVNKKELDPNFDNYISLNQYLLINNLFYLHKDTMFYPTGYITKTNYAYIFIPGFIGEYHDDLFSYIILYIIKDFSKRNPVGWIFDFRGNTGGIIHSFVNGFLFILDKFSIDCLDKNGNKQMVLAFNGSEIYNQYVGQEPEIFGYFMPIDNIEISNVHVIIDRNTASCGEFMTYLLKKQKKATIYGQPSFGVPTWIEYGKLQGFKNTYEVELSYPKLLLDFKDVLRMQNLGGFHKIIADFEEIPYNIFGMK
jgi:C-terminal processing protease CtpA/Prc